MANYRAILLSSILLLLASCAGIHAQNLLTDPGFEAVPSWTNYGEGIYAVSAWRYFSVSGAGGNLTAVTPGYEGNRAVKLTRVSAAGDSGMDRAPDFVPVLPGHRYRAVVWARSEANSRLLIVLAPHDSARTFLGTQRQVSFQVGSTYRRFVVEYTTPANTAYLNFATRVDGPGDLTVDSCELTDLSITKAQTPTVTYPVSETVDSFRPTIAFQGPPHPAYQCIITSGDTTVWDSGAVTSTAFTCRAPSNLSPGVAYQAKVRVQNAVGWSDYSTASTFSTPIEPIVRFTTCRDADVLRGPSITVRWLAEAATGITAQSISIDGGTPITLTTSRRYRSFSNLTEGVHTVTLWVYSAQGLTIATSRFYVRRTPADSGTVYYYDLSNLWAYSLSDPASAKIVHDTAAAVCALQGLVNRSGPRLFVKLWSDDSTWLSRMTEYGNWLYNKTVVTLPSGVNGLQTLFNTFSSDYEGAVVWDPNVNSTCNVAVTVAGADNMIPIRYDPTPGSVYDRLIATGPQIPVQLDLRDRFTGTGTVWDTAIPSTGSAKNDAYVWARTKYLETGKSNPSMLYYALDGHWIQNAASEAFPTFMVFTRDYAVQNRAFCFDLSVWADEAPNDDPTQPLGTDLNTLRSILHAAATRAPGMVEIVGYVPWAYKYTTHDGHGIHDPVPTEWEATRWFTYHNAYVDADAMAYCDFPNLSLYSIFPLPDRLTQNRRVSHTELRKLGYLSADNIVSPLNYLNFYMGDWDSAVWLGLQARAKWDDANRGVVPISWPFNPNLIKRAAGLYEYYSRTRTDNDSFTAGDSGCGYVNPTWLLTDRLSGLPPARDIWIEHNLKYFRQTNVKLSGFLLNGCAGPIGADVDSMFEAFSGDGVFSQAAWYPQGEHMSGTMPALVMREYLTGTSSTDAGMIQAMGLQDTVNFVNNRVILKGPTYVVTTFDSIKAADTSVPWALVDAYTYAALSKCHMGAIPDYRAAYTFDTIPDTVTSAQPTYVSVGVRNDGWVTWDAQGDQAITLLIKWLRGAQVVKTQSVPIPCGLPSSEGRILDFAIVPPTAPGQYTLSYEMCRGTTPFSARGDYAWESIVSVTEPYLQVSPAQAKAYWDGLAVTMPGVRVTVGTDQFADAFWVQDEQRASGIKVSLEGTSGITVSEGDLVTVIGRLATDAATLERMLADPAVVSQSPGSTIEPLGMPGRSVGGGLLNAYTTDVPGMSGLLNTGLLVRAWGRVENVDAGLGRCFIYDGSREGGLLVDCGNLASGNSISMPGNGDWITVTGISSMGIVGGGIAPTLRPRDQSDMLVVPAP